MLSFFRRGVWAKVMLVILGIGLFAIVITGFGTGGIGGLDSLAAGGSTLASVEGEKIDSEEANDVLQSQLKRIQQERPQLDMSSFVRSGALEEVVSQMVTNMARLVFGKEQGLVASKAMIDRLILGNRSFQNAAGQFDETVFRNALQQEGVSEGQLRRDIERSLIDQQLMAPVGFGVQVPEGIAAEYASLLLESRTGSIGVVPAAAMGTGVEPTDAEIAAFYRTNQARYMIPERRVIRYMLFGTEQVAAQSKATDAEIADRYRRNAAAFAPRETRRLSRVRFGDEAAARAFAARIAGGTSFAEAASRAGFGPADTALPEQDKAAFAKLTSPAVADAAFAAAKGTVTAPVRAPLGWFVVRVDDVRTIPGRPLAAVRDELAAQIEADKSIEALTEMVNRIDRSVGEASLEEIARAEKLAIVETPPVTGAGAAPGNPGWVAPPELPAVLRGVSGLTEDDDPLIETIEENKSFALVQVARLIPAAPPALASIRDQVKADLIARRALDRARAVATALVAKINAGTPPARAFAEADVRLPAPETVSALRREIAQDPRRPGQVPPAMAMLFNMPRGKARLLAAPEGRGWFVVHLGTVVRGDARSKPEMIAGIRNEFARYFSEEYARQFSGAIEAGMEIERNDKAIADLKKRLSGGS